MPESPYTHEIADAVAAGNSAAVLALLEKACREREEEHAAELRKREEEFHVLAENLPDGIIRFDHDFRITYANSSAAGMMGSTVEELQGKRPLEFPMPMHVVFLWQAGVERAFASGRKEYFEYAFDDQRTVHYLQITIVPELGSEGRVASVLAITRDVSEQKKTAVALRDSEERFRLALGTTHITVYTQDGSLRYTWADSSNPKLSAETFLGRTDHDIYPAEVADLMSTLKQQVLMTGQAEHVECDVPFDDEKGWLDITIAPLRNNEGQVVGITGVALDTTERKRAEATLQKAYENIQAQSEQLREVNQRILISSIRQHELTETADNLADRLKQILNALPVGIMTAEDPECRVISTNPAGSRMFEVPAGENISAPALSVHRFIFQGRELLPEEMPLQRAVFGNRDVHDMEIEAHLSSGRSWTGLFSATPLHDQEGNVIGGITIAADITERKRVEETLQASEAILEAFFDASPGVLNIIDEEFRYVKTGSITPTYFGLNRQNIVGKLLKDLAPEFEREYGPMLKRILETGKPELNVEVHSPDSGRPGEIIYWMASYFPVPLPGGKRGIGIMGVEITDMKKAANALKESESKFRALFSAMSDVILVLDSDGRYLEIPQTSPDLLYKPDSELLGKTLAEVFPAEKADFFLQHIRETLEKRKPVTIEYSLMIHHAEHWFSATLSPLSEKSVISVAHDITERKQAEERIARLRREQEAYLRHEMKNLITPIQLFAEMVEDSENLTGEQRVYLRRIVEMSKQAVDYIEATRTLEMIETGKYQLKRVEQSLNDTIEAAIQNLTPLAANSGVTLRFHTSEEDPVTSLDPQLIPGVFTNLIKNAIEHVAELSTPEEKTVSIDLSRERHRYVIRINNKGEPIPQDRVATFFDKYNVGPEKRSGTGLGTTYAWLVTKAHGGNIAVSSNAEEGTTVTVALPVENH